MAKSNHNRTPKILKYGLGGILVCFALYHSVYFKRLDDVKAQSQAATFDPASYADDFWKTRLLSNLGEAVGMAGLISTLESNPSEAFERHSHALGIGNIRFFLVSGTGTVSTISDNGVEVAIDGSEAGHTVTIATEFIFGNAIRDASGQIDINEFDNTMDFNNVSAEINRIVRETVLPPFRQQVTVGSKVAFSGAVELNREHFIVSQIEIIPVKLTLM